MSFDTISEWQEGASYVVSEEEGVEAQGYSLAESQVHRSRFKYRIFEESKKKERLKKTRMAGAQWSRRKGAHVEIRYKSRRIKGFEL